AFSAFATYDGQRAAECSLRFAQLAILLSQARVPGFGGPSSIQYTTPATFKGTLEGTLVVNVDGLFNPRTTLTYTNFTDYGGFTLDRTIITQTDSGGNGTLFSAVAPTYTKAGAAQPLWAGTITFGQEDGSGDTLTLAGGVVTGGKYHVDDSSGGHYVFPYTDILETNVLNGCFAQ
ncbi:MAG: hypothetical protein JST92_08190, partial [Deltaproteobacteria bacterium]|nr:hypothetical protein [Deltaproteobacteria bacterium]